MELILSSLLWITVFAAGTPIKCLFDSGAESTVISESVARRVNAQSTNIATGPIVGVNGVETKTRSARLAHVGNKYLGWESITALVVELDAPMKNLFGEELCIIGASDMRRQPPLVFDFSRGAIYPVGLYAGITGAGL
jgi:hypothetical protein